MLNAVEAKKITLEKRQKLKKNILKEIECEIYRSTTQQMRLTNFNVDGFMLWSETSGRNSEYLDLIEEIETELKTNGYFFGRKKSFSLSEHNTYYNIYLKW